MSPQQKQIYDCVARYGADYKTTGLCITGTQLSPEQRRLANCVMQNKGSYIQMGVCAAGNNLTPEQQVFVSCAISTGGQPFAFAGCVGTQLTLNELDKCFSRGIWGDGCFGKNNTAVEFVSRAWKDVTEGPGPSNDLVGRDGVVATALENARRDVVEGPGENNISISPGKFGLPGPKRPSILESGYDFLYAKAMEADGYGLYSYVILPSVSDRAAALLDEVFKSFPPASGLQTPRIRTNILYIPTKEESQDKFNLSADASREAVRVFLSSHYDLSMARLLLDHLCDKPAEEVRQLCQNDLTGGPYILTYASKISDLSPLPPPFLFADLTNVHQRAFGQFVSAYRSQVKSPKFSDRAKIDTFRLTLLNVTLTFADWVQPISAAVADIIHQANPKEKPKAEKRWRE